MKSSLGEGTDGNPIRAPSDDVRKGSYVKKAIAIAGFSILGFAACSSNEPEGLNEFNEYKEEIEQAVENAPSCTPHDGETVTFPDHMCMRGDEMVLLGFFECDDGTKLYSLDNGWVSTSDNIFHESEDVAGDPAYSEAFQAC